MTLAFLPSFKTPIILATVGSLLMIACFHALTLIKPGGDGVINGNIMAPILIGAAAGMMITGILLLLSLSLGTLRLAGFVRAFLRCPQKTMEADYQNQVKVYLIEGLSAVRSHKAYLVKAWLVSTVIMIPLLFVWCACSLIIAGLSPEMIEQYKFPAEVVPLRQGAIIAAAIVGILISNYSITTLAVSVMLDRSVKETSIEALWLAITTSPALTLISLLSFVAVTVLTTPGAALSLLHPVTEKVLQITPLSYVSELWQGISGVILIPICTAMLCEVVRDCVVIDSSES